jgi:HEPN domain-containing protein
MDDGLRKRVEAELVRAERARQAGQEGRARVCARRAAGWSLQGYFRRRTGRAAPENALDLLRWLQSDVEAPSHLRRAAERLTARLTQDHRLPHQEDPLDDARRIVNAYREGPE